MKLRPHLLLCTPAVKVEVVLVQAFEGTEHFIAYAIHTLSKAETNCRTTER